MVVLLVIVAVLLGLSVTGWRMVAGATSPQAANGVLLLLAVLAIGAWLWSETTFAAGA